MRLYQLLTLYTHYTIYYVGMCSCYREVLSCFTRVELLDWGNFQESYSDILRGGSSEEPGTDVLQPSTDDGNKHWEELRKRIVEYVRSLHMCIHV